MLRKSNKQQTTGNSGVAPFSTHGCSITYNTW